VLIETRLDEAGDVRAKRAAPVAGDPDQGIGGAHNGARVDAGDAEGRTPGVEGAHH
jgi:hypothetical protein